MDFSFIRHQRSPSGKLFLCSCESLHILKRYKIKIFEIHNKNLKSYIKCYFCSQEFIPEDTIYLAFPHLYARQYQILIEQSVALKQNGKADGSLKAGVLNPQSAAPAT